MAPGRSGDQRQTGLLVASAVSAVALTAVSYSGFGNCGESSEQKKTPKHKCFFCLKKKTKTLICQCIAQFIYVALGEQYKTIYALFI